jgi:hypothetical protein
MSDDELLEVLKNEGYRDVRRLPNGELAGLLRFLWTTGLCVGLDRSGYRTRFCYEGWNDALQALDAWDGEGFPPGWWIKEKPENISNPARDMASA